MSHDVKKFKLLKKIVGILGYKLIDKSSALAVEMAIDKQSGVVGLSESTGNIELINFKEIKGNKPFDINCEWFEEMIKKSGVGNRFVILRKRYLPEEQDFGITMSNRGGMLGNAEHSVKPKNSALEEKCYYPSYKFFLDYNGDVLMCSHDWGKKNILGNLKKQNFIDIWTSEKSNKARKKLFNSKRDFSPCNVCDAKGDLIGNIHSEAWKEIL